MCIKSSAILCRIGNGYGHVASHDLESYKQTCCNVVQKKKGGCLQWAGTQQRTFPRPCFGTILKIVVRQSIGICGKCITPLKSTKIRSRKSSEAKCSNSATSPFSLANLLAFNRLIAISSSSLCQSFSVDTGAVAITSSELPQKFVPTSFDDFHARNSCRCKVRICNYNTRSSSQSCAKRLSSPSEARNAKEVREHSRVPAFNKLCSTSLKGAFEVECRLGRSSPFCMTHCTSNMP